MIEIKENYVITGVPSPFVAAELISVFGCSREEIEHFASLPSTLEFFPCFLHKDKEDGMWSHGTNEKWLAPESIKVHWLESIYQEGVNTYKAIIEALESEVVSQREKIAKISDILNV